MGRVFLAITCPDLIALMVDSALHDPDVHPVVVRAVHSVPHTVNAIFARFGIEARASDGDTQSRSAPLPKRTHSPMPGWYWSTIATVAVASIWLIKMALSVTFRNRSARAFVRAAGDPAQPESWS